jgi:Icc-related predicted phosphoesterase
MKLLVIADNNDFVWSGAACDVDAIVSCGDAVDQLVLSAAKAVRCHAVFAVKGNHDADSPFPAPIIDLHLRVHTLDGIRFGGLNGSWKYKARGPFLYEQAEVTGLLQDYPAVDLFVSHNSPRSVHDKNDGIHFGFDGLLAYIHQHKPRLLIHGHQHVNTETTVGATRVVGVYGHRIIEL